VECFRFDCGVVEPVRLGKWVGELGRVVIRVGGLGVLVVFRRLRIPKTAEVLVTTLDDVHRFDNARQVSAYIGLVPRQYQSGETDRNGRITKRGWRLLRTILLECAWCALRYNDWARESDAEIAEQTNLLPDAVAWYERIYFNVRDRLNARIWILKTIRCRGGRESMECGDSLSRIERFQFYKLMGYFGGPVVLDVAIGALSDRLVEKQYEITGWLDDAMRSRIKQLAILSVRRLDGRDAIGVFRAHADLMNRNLDRDDPSQMIEKNIEAFLEHLPWDVADR
jgi:hypothetical protein